MADSSIIDAPQTNGDVDSLTTKRKHENGDAHSDMFVGPPAATQQENLSVILKSNDTSGLITEQEFQEIVKSKRAKTANKHQLTSIAEKLQSARYTQWPELLGDIEIAKEAAIRRVREKDGEQAVDSRPSVDDLKKIQRATTMAAVISNIASSEMEKYSTSERTDHNVDKVEPKTGEKSVTGTVLTLFGNAPTPKQLFSSLQNNAARATSTIRSELSVDEMSLPNGLNATTIKTMIPATQKGPTFSDAFPAPSTLPQLSPPKPNKRLTSSANVVKWENRLSSRGSKRGGYTTQPLAVAEWLSYGAGESRRDSLSPLEKRKQRDRALSSGKGSEVSQETLGAELARQEEALFQRAYSSFAPAYDNSKSLIDAGVKNMVWWHKIGSRQFDERFAGAIALGANTPIPTAPVLNNGNVKEDFSRVVEDYEEVETTDEKLDMTNVDTVLSKIHDLLDTLSSYQFIRNSALPASAAPRPPVSPAPIASGKTEKPDEPSEAEVEVYEQLRREIAYLILQLPPYAVAKIDGEQLSELGVSRYLTYTSADSRGQLEEDQVARHARYTAAATAASVASLTRASTLNNPHYSSSSRTPAIGQSANTRYGQSAGYNRAAFSTTMTQRQGGSSYATPTAPPRSQYASTSQYARSGASQSQSYGTAAFRPPSYSNYNGTQARPSTQSFQQRSQMAANNAVSYQTSSFNQSSAKSSSTGQHFTQQLQAGSDRSPAGTPITQQARAPLPLVPRTGTPQSAVNGHA